MKTCRGDWLNDDVNWCNCVTISSEIRFASKGMLDAWLKNVHHTLLKCVACFWQDSDQSHACFLFCCNVTRCCVSSSWGMMPAWLTHLLITFYSSDVVIKRLRSSQVTSVFSQSCWHLFWKKKNSTGYILFHSDLFKTTICWNVLKCWRHFPSFSVNAGSFCWALTGVRRITCNLFPLAHIDSNISACCCKHSFDK